MHQGRYKSFAAQTDAHLSTVDRYIARNALRSKLAERAELWPWSEIGQSALPAELQVPLSEMPTKRRTDWIDWVNRPQTAAEEEAIRRSIKEGRTFGTERWIARKMGALGWKEPGRPGRPLEDTAKPR